jgi:ketosteroid isomerase-like protein
VSTDALDVVRAMYDAFNRGEPSAILELADPAVTVEDHAVIDGTTYEGLEGVVQFLAFQAEAFAAHRVDLEEVLETGDEIVVVIRLRGEGPLSQIPLEGNFTHVWQIDEGMVQRLRVYATKEEALEAAGRG